MFVALTVEKYGETIVINPNDLIINSWSSRKYGSYHLGSLNGVQILHKPSGIVVEVDKYRSQHKNKNKSLSILKDKLKESENE